MTYARIHATITWHAKTMSVSDAALGVWARLLGHCAGQLSDGFVLAAVAQAIGARSPGALDELVAAGFLDVVSSTVTRDIHSDSRRESHEPVTRYGYQLRNYTEHNASRRAIETAREQARERQSRSRSTSKSPMSRVTDGVTHAVTDGVTATVTHAVSSTVSHGVSHTTRQEVDKKTATPSSRERAHTREAATSLDAFDALAAITAGATKGKHPSAWDHRGDSRTVAAFVGALRAQGRTEAELRTLGAYLASDDCAAKFKAKSFAPRSFVFRNDDGLDASRTEHLCLAAREWAASRSAPVVDTSDSPALPSPFLTPPRPIKRPTTGPLAVRPMTTTTDEPTTPPASEVGT